MKYNCFGGRFKIKIRIIYIFLCFSLLVFVSCTGISDIKIRDFEPAEKTNELQSGITEEDHEKQEQQKRLEAELLISEREARSSSWEEAKAAALSEPSLMPVYEFIDSLEEAYYEEYKEKIEDFFEEMRGDPEYYKDGTLDELEYFLTNFPEHIYTGSALEKKKEFEKNLIEFAQEQKISGIITGSSINEINLTLRNNTDSRLIAHLPLGLYFMANSGYVQNMVLTKSLSVSVPVGEHIKISVPAACMNIYKDIPGTEDLFYLAELQEDDPLIELLEVLSLHDTGFEVVQAAVWYMRDNPSKQYMLDALEYDDGEKAITEEIYQQAAGLVDLLNDK
ncbi:MAG: hypothetical protein FWH24_05855 [Oscillospiraceae bacterium]|nr:hypothetical protein [Oscillospiraceae bacterium]